MPAQAQLSLGRPAGARSSMGTTAGRERMAVGPAIRRSSRRAPSRDRRSSRNRDAPSPRRPDRAADRACSRQRRTTRETRSAVRSLPGIAGRSGRRSVRGAAWASHACRTRLDAVTARSNSAARVSSVSSPARGETTVVRTIRMEGRRHARDGQLPEAGESRSRTMASCPCCLARSRAV